MCAKWMSSLENHFRKILHLIQNNKVHILYIRHIFIVFLMMYYIIRGVGTDLGLGGQKKIFRGQQKIFAQIFSSKGDFPSNFGWAAALCTNCARELP